MVSRKIIIFDDEKDILKVAQKKLEKSGFKVAAFSSSRNSLEDIKREKPDLILLDISMPHKDGYQVCDEVRCDSATKDIPIIVFTAQPLEKHLIDRAHQFYGANDYIEKPFEYEQLVQKIKKLLG
jgi:two-component system response regulator VicR